MISKGLDSILRNNIKIKIHNQKVKESRGMYPVWLDPRVLAATEKQVSLCDLISRRKIQ